MLVFPRWIQQTFSLENSTQGGPQHSKWRQQELQEEEIPVQAMAALKISRKHHPRGHQPYDLPTWGQIKTLINKAEDLISQQEMSQSPEDLPITMQTCTTPAQAGLTNLLTQLPFISGHKIDREKTNGLYQPMTPPTCPLPGTLTPWGGGKTN